MPPLTMLSATLSIRYIRDHVRETPLLQPFILRFHYYNLSLTLKQVTARISHWSNKDILNKKITDLLLRIRSTVALSQLCYLSLVVNYRFCAKTIR